MAIHCIHSNGVRPSQDDLQDDLVTKVYLEVLKARMLRPSGIGASTHPAWV